MKAVSPRVDFWRAKRRRGEPLFFIGCASAEEAAACLPMSPDLVLYHPYLPARHDPAMTGMLAGLRPEGSANEAAAAGFPPMPAACAPCAVALGLCGSDPFLLHPAGLEALKAAGLEGAANFPTLVLVDGFFRADLESSGLGLARERECLAGARELGLFTVGLVGRPEEVPAFAETGCDALIAHLGLTPEYAPRPLSEALEDWEGYRNAAATLGPDGPLLLLHGEHLARREDIEAWRAGAARDCAGLFADGGPERIRALRALA